LLLILQPKSKPNASLCGGKDAQSLSDGFCLFDVVLDPAERHDLSADPKYAVQVKAMMAKLVAAGTTAGPQAKITDDNSKMNTAICAVMKKNGGYVQPADMYEPWPPAPAPPTPKTPTPPPAPTPPAPIPKACEKLLQKDCPGPFKTPDKCLTCTRDIPDVTSTCKPKERHAFCGDN
jgi:hypothetical protein